MEAPDSVNGKNLTMFSFEGDFKSRPRVSLGGASKKVRHAYPLFGRWSETNLSVFK